jgi:hypothetical protein
VSFSVKGRSCLAEPEEVDTRVVRAQRQRPPVNPEAPVLTKTGYYTVPPVKRLKRMTNQQLKVRPSPKCRLRKAII